MLRQIFTLAERLEPDHKAIWDWLFHTPLQKLGGRTALELVFSGHGEQVLAMLKKALRDEERNIAALFATTRSQRTGVIPS